MNAVIFDMDGVLIDSEPVYKKTNYRFFDSINIEVDACEYSTYLGITLAEMCQLLCRKHDLHYSADELFELLNEHHLQDESMILEEINAPIQGVKNLLQALQISNIKIGLASSAPLEWINQIMHKIDMREYFDVIVSGGHVERGKPFPDIFLKCASLLGIDPAECVVIEDAAHGIAAAKSANMYCIGFTNSNANSQDVSQSDLIMDCFDDENVKRIINLYSGSQRQSAIN